MSTAAIPGDFTSVSPGSQLLPEFAGIAPPIRARVQPISVRRRANAKQGRALEIIGHAIEYLVDSRLFITSGLDERGEQEAVQILMRTSRAVFAECPEIVPLRRQMRQWIAQRLPWTD